TERSKPVPKKVILFLLMVLFLCTACSGKLANNIDDFMQVQTKDVSKEEQETTSNEKDDKWNHEIVKVKVDHVVDADTISIIPTKECDSCKGEKESVRLLLIDTPESVKPDTPVQPYA